MKGIMEIFRATELSFDVRIRIIKKLGQALNNEFGMNWTEEIVQELVLTLEEQKHHEEDVKNLPEF
jgi:hypothetical protein